MILYECTDCVTVIKTNPELRLHFDRPIANSVPHFFSFFRLKPIKLPKSIYKSGGEQYAVFWDICLNCMHFSDQRENKAHTVHLHFPFQLSGERSRCCLWPFSDMAIINHMKETRRQRQTHLTHNSLSQDSCRVQKPLDTRKLSIWMRSKILMCG